MEYTNHDPYFDSAHANWDVDVHVGDVYNLPTMSDDDTGDSVTRTVDLSDGSALPSFIVYDNVA